MDCLDKLQNQFKKSYSLASRICEKSNQLRNPIIREAFCPLKAKEHELEEIATIEGVKYIDDSASTKVNSLWYALDDMPNEKESIILIAGGIDNNLDYSIIDEKLTKKIKSLITLGTDNERLEKAILTNGSELYTTENIKTAIKFISNYAKKGNIVLFSPGCASFNLFKDFEDRGKQFKKAVMEL